MTVKMFILTLGRMEKLIKSDLNKLTRNHQGNFSNIHSDLGSYQKAYFGVAFHNSYLSHLTKA